MPDEDCALLKETTRLLLASKISVQQISLDTQLPFPWLLTVKRRQCRNPGVNRIVKLYEYLSGNALKV